MCHYIRAVKNVTVTPPGEVALWPRIRAVRNGRNGSGWLADLLEGAQRHEDTHDTGMERPLATKPHKSEWMGEDNRNELDEICR